MHLQSRLRRRWTFMHSYPLIFTSLLFIITPYLYLKNQSIEITCSSINEGDATWTETGAGEITSGTCQLGFFGSPTRSCSLQGTWESISNPCQGLPANLSDQKFAFFPISPSLKYLNISFFNNKEVTCSEEISGNANWKKQEQEPLHKEPAKQDFQALLKGNVNNKVLLVFGVPSPILVKVKSNPFSKPFFH